MTDQGLLRSVQNDILAPNFGSSASPAGGGWSKATDRRVNAGSLYLDRG